MDIHAQTRTLTRDHLNEHMDIHESLTSDQLDKHMDTHSQSGGLTNEHTDTNLLTENLIRNSLNEHTDLHITRRSALSHKNSTLILM